MQRRDFLKGLMALAGVAAVGLPELNEVEVLAEANDILVQHDPVRRMGPYGSVRIGDKWYAVHGWHIDMYYDPVDLTYFGEQWRVPSRKGYGLQLDLEDARDLVMLTDRAEFEIVTEAGGRLFAQTGRFCGEGYIAAGSTFIDVHGNVLWSIDIQGTGPLVYNA